MQRTSHDIAAVRKALIAREWLDRRENVRTGRSWSINEIVIGWHGDRGDLGKLWSTMLMYRTDVESAARKLGQTPEEWFSRVRDQLGHEIGDNAWSLIVLAMLTSRADPVELSRTMRTTSEGGSSFTPEVAQVQDRDSAVHKRLAGCDVTIIEFNQKAAKVEADICSRGESRNSSAWTEAAHALGLAADRLGYSIAAELDRTSTVIIADNRNIVMTEGASSRLLEGFCKSPYRAHGNGLS